ncbi:MAG: hypothetical protein ACYTG1_10590 [Planctomycetota bacterium]|jgi:hypothetical protein
MRISSPIALVVMALIVMGCQSKPHPERVSVKYINNNLTPNLVGSAETYEDQARAVSVTNNMNARLFWDDMGRTFYTDHPSRLSPLPIQYTSGNPR